MQFSTLAEAVKSLNTIIKILLENQAEQKKQTELLEKINKKLDNK